MISPVSRLNEAGVQEFRGALASIREGGLTALPRALLDSPRYVIRGSDRLVTSIPFKSKMDAATYIVENVDFRSDPNLLYDAGLWAWLSVFFFRSICPTDDGSRPGADHRYIPAPGRDWRHYYRHLLAGPVRIYLGHGAVRSELLLSSPVHVWDDYNEQLTARQELAASPGVIEAAKLLYWDTVKKRAKRGGAPNTRRPGTLRRYIDLIRQLDMTYDTYAMTGEDIVALLPPEFNAWID